MRIKLIDLDIKYASTSHSIKNASFPQISTIININGELPIALTVNFVIAENRDSIKH